MPLDKKSHKEYYKKYNRDKRKSGDLNFIIPMMLSKAKYRAIRKGIEFTITKDDITWPDVCPVFGTPWNFEGTHKDRYLSPSLDRIDPLKGYIPGNVRVISSRANQVKSNLSFEEIKLLYENFYKVC